MVRRRRTRATTLKYAAAPSVPWLSTLSLFGLGLAGAVSPYLTITLRDMDPRLPFIASSAALALATIGIIWAERHLATASPATPAAVTPKKPVQPVFWFFLAVLLLGIGFQIHFSLNTATLFLRLAKPCHRPIDRLPILGLQHRCAHNFPRPVSQQFMNSHEIAEALAHLFAFDLEKSIVHPEIRHHWRMKGASRLRDLVFVVRKHKVNSATVDVESLSEVLPRHGRALDVPTRPPRCLDSAG